MIETSTRCPACGEHIELSDHGFWCATCVNACAAGGGETPEDALLDWSAAAGRLQCAALSTLATFIVPPPPEGYALRVTEWEGRYPEDAYPQTLADAERTGADIYYGPNSQKAANQ